MTVEIKIGPPAITISQGRTFMITADSGMILTDSDQGLYAIDTRFISFYQLFINRVPLEVINSSQLTFYASRFHLTNPDINTEGGIINANTLGMTINRTVSDSLHEEFEVLNYTGQKVQFLLELAIRSDFADIFEVKNHNIVQRGETATIWHKHHKRLDTSYDHKDFHRAVSYQVTRCSSPMGYANGRIFFEIALEQNESWQMCADLLLEHGQHVKKPSPNSCSFGHRGSASQGPHLLLKTSRQPTLMLAKLVGKIVAQLLLPVITTCIVHISKRFSIWVRSASTIWMSPTMLGFLPLVCLGL